ncbi:MAG: hypothetical protein ACFCD0_19725, partial [Gemmataceae bacterium]
MFSILSPEGAKDPGRAWEPTVLKELERTRFLFLRPPLRGEGPNPSEAGIIASEAGIIASEAGIIASEAG